MPSCATCGGTDHVRLYVLRDARGESGRWWCLDCAYFARRLSGIRADVAPAWVERAALRELPTRPLFEGTADRRVNVGGRRATDRVNSVTSE